MPLEPFGRASDLALRQIVRTGMIAHLIALTMLRQSTITRQARIDWHRAYDGHRLLAADGMSAYLWDANTGVMLQSFTGPTDWVKSVAFAPNGEQVLTATGGARDIPSPRPDRAVELWDIASGKQLRRFEGLKHGVQCFVFSPDGKRLLCIEDGGFVNEWDFDSGQQIASFDGVYTMYQPPSMPEVTFSPDGTRLLACSRFEVVIRDSNTGEKLVSMAEPNQGAIYQTAVFSPDQRWVLTTQDGRVSKPGDLRHWSTLWDAKTGAKIRDFGQATGGITGAFFTAQSSQAVIVSDGAVETWNVETAKMLGSAALPKGFVFPQPCPDGSRCLFRAGASGTLVWNSASRSFTAEVEDASSASAGPVGFSPDGRNFLTRDLSAYGMPQAISIWSSDTGKRLRSVNLAVPPKQ